METSISSVSASRPAAVVVNAAKPVAAATTEKALSPEISGELAQRLDTYSLEAVVELKIARFLDQIGTFYPENLHSMIINKVEKPLLGQILRRTGGNQVHAARILGINRNTLRKKMKMYGF